MVVEVLSMPMTSRFAAGFSSSLKTRSVEIILDAITHPNKIVTSHRMALSMVSISRCVAASKKNSLDDIRSDANGDDDRLRRLFDAAPHFR